MQIEQDLARVRTSEIPVLYGSCEKARRELGWEPQFSLEDTLAAVYEDSLRMLGKS